MAHVLFVKFCSEQLDFFKIAKAVFLHTKTKKHKNIMNLASGCSNSVSTRNLVPARPNVSSVAMMAKEMVTKQAGRVPQHD